MDSVGEPVPGIAVSARHIGKPLPVAKTVVTDRRGVYRLHGLSPGEYFVVASPSLSKPGNSIEVPSASELDAALRALERRHARGEAVRPGEVPQREVAGLPAPVAHTPAPVFYPGTTNPAEAMRVRVEPGRESGGIDVTLVTGGTTFIAGTLFDADGLPAAGALLSVSPAGARGVAPVSRGHSGVDGTFHVRNVPPGQYTLTARLTPLTVSLAQGKPADVTTAFSSLRWATADVDVGSAGLTGLSLTLRPSMTLAGRVVFEGQNAGGGAGIGVQVRLVDDLTGTTTPLAEVSRADGAFEVRGIMPGIFRLDVRTGSSAWWARSAMVEGKDLLDTRVSFGAETGSVAGLVVTISNQTAQLTGTLLDAEGEPVSQTVVVFSAERAFWYPHSRRIASTRADASGRYVVRRLPPGDYLVSVIEQHDPGDLGRPDLFDSFAAAAVKVHVRDGQTTVQNLRIPGRSALTPRFDGIRAGA
jgi:protocatechuate 3,4-dioxygenase beta subunit